MVFSPFDFDVEMEVEVPDPEEHEDYLGMSYGIDEGRQWLRLAAEGSEAWVRSTESVYLESME